MGKIERISKGTAISSDLKNTLSRLVKEHLPGSILEDVSLEIDHDSDGDALLRIVLVLESSNVFNAAAAAGLVRHLRPELEDDLFPLIRFMTAADFRKHQTATE